MIFSDIVLGGFTGLIGGAIQKIADYKTAKLKAEIAKADREHDLAIRKLDNEAMAQEWAQRTKVADIEADAQVQVASYNEPGRYSKSVKPTTGQGWVLVCLDALRGSIRPILTVYMCIISTAMFYKALKSGASIDPKPIVDTILFLTTTSVSWWFGSRGKH